MRNIFKAAGISALAFAASGCTNDITLDNGDLRHEEYVKNFIESFGVPDPDHNYAMAKTAGLKVTTRKGSPVKVIAEVGGEEYLFADLYVPEGETKLPVTLPASVEKVIVVTPYGTQTVDKDATVDIDAMQPLSRTNNDVYVALDPDDDTYKSITFTWSDGDDRYIAFKPSEFLRQYMADNPVGEDNMDYSLPTKGANGGSKGALTVLDANKYVHETVLDCTNRADETPNTFYLFPIYWRKNKDDKKDYRVMLHKLISGETYTIADNDMSYVEFGEPGETTADIPFPRLGYSTTINSREDIDLSNLKEQFIFDDGSFESAFDPEEATMVISRGIKIQLRIGPNRPMLAVALGSGYDEGGSPASFVSSCPFFNTLPWEGKYFDVKIHNLCQAQVATKCTDLGNSETTPIFISDDIEQRIADYKATIPSWAPEGLVQSNVAAFLSSLNAEGDFLSITSSSNNRKNSSKLLAFNAPPSTKADKSNRDFSEVMFIIAPHMENSTLFRSTYTAVNNYEWTIAAEDLGGSDDWDFNDVVFTFTDVICNLKSANWLNSVAMLHGPAWAQAIRKITVTPKAAGGTLPIYITYTGSSIKPMPYFPSDGDEMFSKVEADLIDYLDDKGENGTFIIGCELHKWLGGDPGQMINVGENRSDVSARSVEFVIPTTLDIMDEDLLGYDIKTGIMAVGSETNQPLFGFSVLVDKDNTLRINTFNDKDNGYRKMTDLELGSGSYIIGAPKYNRDLKAPQMILLPGDWEWPAERVNILDAYPNFTDWIANHNNLDWINNPDREKVTKNPNKQK